MKRAFPEPDTADDIQGSHLQCSPKWRRISSTCWVGYAGDLDERPAAGAVLPHPPLPSQPHVRDLLHASNTQDICDPSQSQWATPKAQYILDWSIASVEAEPPKDQPAPINHPDRLDAPDSPDNLDDLDERRNADIEQIMAESRTGRRAEDRSRRESKLRKRSCSPTKQPTKYREIFMKEAGVLVDHCHDPPRAITSLINRLTGGGEYDWDTLMSGETRRRINAYTLEYRESCRALAQKSAGEGEWKSELLSGVVQKLARLDIWNNIVMTSGSEKPWLPTLKPVRSTRQTPYRPPPAIPSLPPPLSRASLPDPKAVIAQPHPSFLNSTEILRIPNAPTPPYDFQNVVLHANLTDTSDTTSTIASTDDDPEALSNSKPDISIGLAHGSFTIEQQRYLNDVNYDRTLHSEPHSAEIGLHFPFLMVEAKGFGNMIGAQNQAAVDAACALNILASLRDHSSRISYDPGVVFTITTEGPLHELWVHHFTDKKYHSTFVKVWRTTTEAGAKGFVETLLKIMGWGSEEFRGVITDRIDDARRKYYGGG